MRLFYRIASTADGGLARAYPQLFDGLGVAGPLFALHPDWTVDLLRSLGKPFFIDPSSYVYAVDLGNLYKEGELRQSYEALARRLELSSVLDDAREIQRYDLLDAAGNVTEFGRDLVRQVIEANELRWGRGVLQLALDDYAAMLEEGKSPHVEPAFIVPPYFSGWADVNLALARETKRRTELPVYLVITIGKEMLGDPVATTDELEAVSEFDGCFLWVSDFQERREPLEKLVRFAELVRSLANTKKPVYNLYGGGFSSLLEPVGLTGYSRGICTSESRDPEMETGQGAPPSRYYVSEALNKIVLRRAQRLYGFSSLEICGCTVCQGIAGRVGEGESQASVAARLFGSLSVRDSRAHFMERHRVELQRLQGLDLSGEQTWLRERMDLLAGSRTAGLVPSEHLSRWAQALGTLSS